MSDRVWLIAVWGLPKGLNPSQASQFMMQEMGEPVFVSPFFLDLKFENPETGELSHAFDYTPAQISPVDDIESLREVDNEIKDLLSLLEKKANVSDS